MVVDRFQSSKGTTKTTGVRYVTLKENDLKEVTVCLCFQVVWEAGDQITTVLKSYLFVFLHVKDALCFLANQQVMFTFSAAYQNASFGSFCLHPFLLACSLLLYCLCWRLAAFLDTFQEGMCLTWICLFTSWQRVRWHYWYHSYVCLLNKKLQPGFSSAWPITPPPHNNSCFQTKLLTGNIYFNWTISRGKIILSLIFPDEIFHPQQSFENDSDCQFRGYLWDFNTVHF